MTERHRLNRGLFCFTYIAPSNLASNAVLDSDIAILRRVWFVEPTSVAVHRPPRTWVSRLHPKLWRVCTLGVCCGCWRKPARQTGQTNPSGLPVFILLWGRPASGTTLCELGTGAGASPGNLSRTCQWHRVIAEGLVFLLLVFRGWPAPNLAESQRYQFFYYCGVNYSPSLLGSCWPPPLPFVLGAGLCHPLLEAPGLV
jgi:hypothetical protein